MKIEYELALEDYLAFADHWVRTSRFSRRNRLWTLSMALAGLLCLIVAIFAFDEWGVFVYLMLGATAASVIAWFDYPKRVRKRTAKIYRESRNKGFFGHHTAEIVDESVRFSSEVDESTVRWGGIEDIVSIDQHTFVVVGAATAHVIPRDIKSGDYDRFVGHLRSSWESYRTATS